MQRPPLQTTEHHAGPIVAKFPEQFSLRFAFALSLVVAMTDAAGSSSWESKRYGFETRGDEIHVSQGVRWDGEHDDLAEQLERMSPTELRT